MVEPQSTPELLRTVGPESLDLRSPPRVAVVGAGIAGLALASLLAEHRFRVRVFDAGGTPGGRIATHRLGGFCFDHGAPYATVRDAEFYQLLEELAAAGVAAHWHGRVRVLEGGQVSDTPGEDPARYVGVPGMSAWAEHLARPLQVACDVLVAAVVRERDRWRVLAADRLLGIFDLVVLAVPAPQAVPLLTAAPALAAQVRGVRMRPTWTLMAAFERPLDLSFDGAFVHGSEVLAWVARDSSKDGRSGAECWVLHARHGWSEAHLEDEPTAVARALLASFSAAAGCPLPEASLALAHRWRYAAPDRALSEPFLTAHSGRLGLCGDWCGGPRVEGAYLSGRALARHLLDRFNP